MQGEDKDEDEKVDLQAEPDRYDVAMMVVSILGICGLIVVLFSLLFF